MQRVNHVDEEILTGVVCGAVESQVPTSNLRNIHPGSAVERVWETNKSTILRDRTSSSKLSDRVLKRDAKYKSKNRNQSPEKHRTHHRCEIELVDNRRLSLFFFGSLIIHEDD